MARTTLPGDERQEEKLNPGQQHADRRFNDMSRAEEKGTFDNIANNYNQTADGSQEDGNIRKLKERESEGDKIGGWKDNTTGDKTTKSPFTQKAKTFFKKRGGIVGLVVALAIGGGAIGTFFGPASMLINLAENATIKNDSSSKALQHRFMNVFGFATGDADEICKQSTNNIKCKMGRISNQALNQLVKKGVTPVFADDVDKNDRKKSGYPSKNPIGYNIDLGDGNGSTYIPKADLIGELVKNPKMAAKVLGRGGAFNVRINAWKGKHITEKLYSKFGLNRNGGLADGSSKGLSPSEKLEEITKKVQAKLVPEDSKLSNVTTSIKENIRNRSSAATKGGYAYTAAVVGCISLKVPGFVAAGTAAVQLAQVMPAGMDSVLSPGAKTKASGVDSKNSITAEDADAIGTLFTNKSARESDGKMTSALDSQILQSSIGVNTAKAAVSKKYTPGYSTLTNPIVIGAGKADEAAGPACNVIMSPAAMYTAMAINGAVTVALSSTIIGGIIKVVGDTVASAIAIDLAVRAGEEAAKAALTDLATNDDIPKASGEAYGDIVGISMASMFSAGGMARNLPVLKESQLADAQVADAKNEAFERDMDIASLSPFDVSSKYTFLGTIVHNAQFAVLKSGSYNGSLLSSLPGIKNFSLASLTTNAAATEGFTNNYCSYAKEFGLEAENPADTPAINMAGLPCTGLINTQINMSTADAIDLMLNEQWLDESKATKDTDSIQDLILSEYIKPETPLADFIESCSNAETGDYLFNAAGCTVGSVGEGTSADIPSLNDPRSLEAMSVFLLDYQQIQSINGNDVGGSSAETAVPATSSAFVLPTDVGYGLSDGWGPRRCAGCSPFHKGIDITNFAGGSEGKAVYSIAEGEVISASKINGVYGNCTGRGVGSNNIVQIKHANGLVSAYYHMSANNITVNIGDKVTAGQPIGKIGNCGQSYGAHLHFEISIGDTTDPALLAIGGSDAHLTFRNPGTVMSLLGVDIINGVYTDGR